MSADVHDLLMRRQSESSGTNDCVFGPEPHWTLLKALRTWTEIAKLLGIGRFGFRELRHTFAYWICDNDVDVITACRLLGVTLRTSLASCSETGGDRRLAIEKIGSTCRSRNSCRPAPAKVATTID